MWTYMRAVGRNCGVNLIALGGTETHVHLLMAVPTKTCVAEIVRTLKSNSSRWMGELGHRFAWQDGYAAISVSPSQVPAVVKYIANQPEHHRKHTFEREYRSLLVKSGVRFDPATLF